MTIFHNFRTGTVDDNPLLVGATTINSSEFASLPAVTAPNRMKLTLDPLGANGNPEIVYVTAHTAASTAVTVTRGQETSLGGFAAKQHPQGTLWICAATADDFLEQRVTAKGDLLIASANGTITRQAVPSDVGLLLSDSAQSTGWSAVGNAFRAEGASAAVAASGITINSLDIIRVPAGLTTGLVVVTVLSVTNNTGGALADNALVLTFDSGWRPTSSTIRIMGMNASAGLSTTAAVLSPDGTMRTEVGGGWPAWPIGNTFAFSSLCWATDDA